MSETIDDLIKELRRLQELATPGEWYISELDGAWAAAVSSPLMEALAANLGSKMGGPERPIGENDFSMNDEAYALACVNAVPRLMAEIERLRAALGKINDIRNSIIGLQRLNWSEHVYPLVAALDEAGIAGMGYDKARPHYASLVERVIELDATVRDLLASAHPHPVEHPTMTAAWKRAEAVLAKEPQP